MLKDSIFHFLLYTSRFYFVSLPTVMGILYIVPTPVGNMEDMTFRAVRILKEVDLVLAEDTRTSGILLKHYDIHNQLMSHHKFNEHGTSAGIVSRLQAGENVALISDAGTPGISDPGFFLVREAVRAGIEVQCLPGATAFVPALVLSMPIICQVTMCGIIMYSHTEPMLHITIHSVVATKQIVVTHLEQ